MIHSDSNTKVAVITGAASGLGKALALELYRQNYHIALIDIDQAALCQAVEAFVPERQKISIYPADVSNEEQVHSTHKAIMKQHGRVDWLINNAAISISQPFEALRMKNFRRLFNVNFWGYIYCTHHFLPALRASPDARLVNVISGFAQMGFPGKTAYGSSKSAIMGFTNALMIELGETNVKVSLVIPPPMDTALVKKGLPVNEESRRREMSFLTKHGIPLDRTAQKIIRQVTKGKYRIVVGRQTFFIDLAARLFPTLVHLMIQKRRKELEF